MLPRPTKTVRLRPRVRDALRVWCKSNRITVALWLIVALLLISACTRDPQDRCTHGTLYAPYCEGTVTAPGSARH